MWQQTSAQTDVEGLIPQVRQGASVKGPLFMDHTTSDEAVFHIQGALFAPDKEGNIACEEPLIDEARLSWREETPGSSLT